MLRQIVVDIIDKLKNPILDLPYNDQKKADNQLTYSNYGRLRNLLFFMSAFSLILLSMDFVFYNEWSENNLIILFLIADIVLVTICFLGVFIIQKKKTPSIPFQKRIIFIYILIGAVLTGFLSGQDFKQNDITLVAGVFILTGGFLLTGKTHFYILISLYTSYTLMHISNNSVYHDSLTDFVIIPGTMIIAWIYGRIMYKNKIDSIYQSLKLQSYSNKLQTMVEQRTSELKQKNDSLIKEIKNKEYIQNQLIASEGLFKSILFQSPDSVAIFKIGGDIVQWNSKAEEYSGIKAENLVGKNIWDLFLRIFADNEENHKLKREVKEFIDQVIQKPVNTKVLKVRHWVTQDKNTKRYLESKLFPIHLQDKTLIAVVSRNITQQLENEIQLKEATQNAELANRAKSDFLANISHDLRSPLNSISGFSQLLKLKPNLSNEKQLKYLNIIYDNGQYLLQLINSLIDLSKLQSGNIKLENSEFPLKEFMHEINSIIDSEKTLYAPNIELKNNCNLDEISIYTDRTKLMQIFTNLLSNALKFTNKGTVYYECKIVDEKFTGIISDTGIGMSENEKEQIFDRFYSAQNTLNIKRKGKGLGLAIVKGYIELLNGEIHVESEKGKGTRFTFSIPIKVLKNKKIANTNIKPTAGKKILIYDTNEESKEFTTELLLTYSLQIDSENNLENLSSKADHYRPDLLLIDIESDYSLYKKHLNLLKHTRPELPILAYTALPQTELPNDLSMLFDVIIFKPINADVLIRKIAKHL
jgi:PAS domain S-box-containing protein